MPALTSIQRRRVAGPWRRMEATRARWRFHHLGRRAALPRRIGAGVLGFVQRLEPDRRPFRGLVWRESASNGESRVWGRHGVGGEAVWRWQPLGSGPGVYDQIEKTSVFPVVIVDWRLNDRWRFGQSAAQRPDQPCGAGAGLPLRRRLTAGVGVYHRSVRFG